MIAAVQDEIVLSIYFLDKRPNKLQIGEQSFNKI